MKPLILIGAGGHCRSVIEAAESNGRRIAGILDRPGIESAGVSGYPVLGCDDDISQYVAECEFVVTLGMVKSAERRRQLHQLVLAAGGSLATVIASTAFVSPRAELGAGTVVLHQAVVNAGAVVGTGCIINTAAVVEHDARVGNYTHISTGAIVNGGAAVGAACMVGSHATLLHGVTVCDQTVIGAAATVVGPITTPGTYTGIVK